MYKQKPDSNLYLEDNVLYIYQCIVNELVEELDAMNQVTDLYQIFKDNNIVVLRLIFENARRNSKISELNIKAG